MPITREQKIDRKFRPPSAERIKLMRKDEQLLYAKLIEAVMGEDMTISSNASRGGGGRSTCRGEKKWPKATS
jgi:hypothetical protein